MIDPKPSLSRVRAARRPLPELLLLAAAALLAGCAEAPQRDALDMGAKSEQVVKLLKERAEILDAREFGIGRRIADLGFTDLDGQGGKLSDYAGAKALVVFVRDVGCPVGGRYGESTARLDRELSEVGAAILYVNLSEHNTVEEMQGEVEQFDFEGRYAHDPEMHFGRELGVRTTTDVFVLDPSRTLRYRGAIDDQYGRGYSLEKPRRQFLREAVEAVLNGDAVVVEATTAPGCAVDVKPPPVLAGALVDGPTYHGEISRIVQANCVECHRDGGAGPFPLDTYERLSGRKAMVRLVVENKIMPPWFTTHDTGPWLNDRRLPDEDRENLLFWINNGMPEGDPKDAPTPRDWTDEWGIGVPDMVFQLDQPSRIPAEGEGSYRPLYLTKSVPRDLWIRKVQVLPTEPKVVHHAMVMIKKPAGWDEYGDQVGRAMVPWAAADDGWEFFAGFLPGKNPHVYPEGTARFLPKGTKFLFYMHYTPNGVRVEDQTMLGLVTTEVQPEFIARTQIVRNRKIFLAPHAADVEFLQKFPIRHDMVVNSLTPHMHFRGREFYVDLALRDGTVEKLLDIPEWDPEWQFNYVFLNERVFPAGSTLRVRAVYDNSAENPNNPDPTQKVKNGPLVKDEMMMLAVEWMEPRTKL